MPSYVRAGIRKCARIRALSYCRTSSCKRQKSQGKRRMMPVLEVPPSVVPQMVVCSLSGVWILVIAGRAEQHTLAQVH